MQFVINNDSKFGNSVKTYSVLTALSGLACIIYGYFFMPFASAFLALLLLNEGKSSKITAVLISASGLIVGFFVNPYLSVNGFSYVLLGLIIWLCFKKSVSKRHTAFLCVLTVFCLFVVSVIFNIINEVGRFTLDTALNYYKAELSLQRELFISKLAELTAPDSKGMIYFVYNRFEASEIFDSLISMLLPFTFAAAFLISGFALKLFAVGYVRSGGNNENIQNWRFYVSNMTAYLYIIVSVMDVFTYGMGNIFAQTVSVLRIIFLIVFLYSGFGFVSGLIKKSGSSMFWTLLLAFALFSIPSYLLAVISYVGVYFTFFANRVNKSNGESKK